MKDITGTVRIAASSGLVVSLACSVPLAPSKRSRYLQTGLWPCRVRRKRGNPIVVPRHDDGIATLTAKKRRLGLSLLLTLNKEGIAE